MRFHGFSAFRHLVVSYLEKLYFKLGVVIILVGEYNLILKLVYRILFPVAWMFIAVGVSVPALHFRACLFVVRMVKCEV